MQILKFEHHHFGFGEVRMPLNIHQKIILTFIIVNLVGIFYLELFHIILGIFHMLFEYAEEFLDMVVEHFLETGTHETQVIVFYILSPVIFSLLYLLYRLFPRFYFKQKTKLDQLKLNTLAQWHALPLIQRFEWWAFFVAYLSYFLFFSF
jgi:hypothetical protein